MPALPFYAAIGWHWWSSLRDLDSNLAVIAGAQGQSIGLLGFAGRALKAAESVALAGVRRGRRVGPEFGPTPALSGWIPTGMHGPTFICWASLTPSSLTGRGAGLRHRHRSRARRLHRLRQGSQQPAHRGVVRRGPERHGGPERLPEGLSTNYTAIILVDALCPIQFWSAKCLSWPIVTRARAPRQVRTGAQLSAVRRGARSHYNRRHYM